MSFHPFYSQSTLLTCKNGLKLVCNLNILHENLNSENSHDNAQKQNYSFMNRLIYSWNYFFNSIYICHLMFPFSIVTCISVIFALGVSGTKKLLHCRSNLKRLRGA
jgi:hypothetical protein